MLFPVRKERRPKSVDCLEKQVWPQRHQRSCRTRSKLSVCWYAVALIVLRGSSASSRDRANNIINNVLPVNKNPLEASSSSSVSNPLIASSTTSAKNVTTSNCSPTETDDPVEPAKEKIQTKVNGLSKNAKKENNGINDQRASKKNRNNKASSRPSPASVSSLSSTQSLFLRRIQREWKDAVKMGIAYDWVNQKPIRLKAKKKKTGEDRLTEESSNSNTDDRTFHLCLGPLGSNLFVWHFSILGLEGSSYADGIYHGRLILPPQYPASPPRVQVWTPSGRFVPLADICLSVSAFHPETWEPSAWNLRTIIESLRLHFITPALEIGGMSKSPEERQEWARQSRYWKQSFRVTASKKKTKETMVVTVDHENMIKQGVFASSRTMASADISAKQTTAADELSEQVNKSGDKGGNIVETEETPPISAVILTEFKSTAKIEKALSEATPQTKQRRRNRKVEKATHPSDLIAIRIKMLLSNRYIRLALVLLLVYKVVFGVP